MPRAMFAHVAHAAAVVCVLWLAACRPCLEDKAPPEAGRPSPDDAEGGRSLAPSTSGGPLRGLEAKEDLAGTPGPRPALAPVTPPPGGRLSLFDGKTLEGWQVTEKDDFSLHGEVRTEDGAVLLGEGMPYTGITWARGFPTEGYEVALEAKRLSGYDIFCGLTVPVGESHVTLVLGGWGDSLVGLSNVDHFNASENETTKMMSFVNGRWYAVRMRVTAAKIEAWIDGEQVVELARQDRAFTIYDQLEPQKPLGLFSWQTRAAVRSIEMTRLAAPAP